MSEARSFLDTVSLPVQRRTVRDVLTGECLAVYEGALDREARAGVSEPTAKFAKGDRVVSLVGHMPGMAGSEGTIEIVRTAPAYYGVRMDGEDEVHKWLAEDELSASSGDGKKDDDAKKDKRHKMRGGLAAHAASMVVHKHGHRSAVADVAIVDVMGPLAQRTEADFFGMVEGYDAIETRFAAAVRSDADAIVLRIDSPGGDAAGCFEAVKRMRAAAQAAGKPVVAFADEMAASAAYAIASVADAGIVVPASGLVGSVGVIAMHASQARALTDAGIDVTVFRSGKRKAEGTMAEPLSDDAAEAMQARVDALAQQFGALVAEARGMTADAVLGYEGAIFTAADAVKNGLADHIGTLDDAVAMAAKAARSRRKERQMNDLKAALGLPESYAGDIVADVAQINSDRVRMLAALGVKSADEAVGVVEGLRAMADLAADAQKRAVELEAAQAKADVEAAIREGREAGKLTAATEVYWRARTAAEIRGYCAVAPVVIPGAGEDEPKPAAVTGGRRWEDFSAQEKAEMQESDPGQFQALLKDYRARSGRRG